MRTTCRVSGKKLAMLADFGDLYISNFYRNVTPDAPRAPLKLGLGEESRLLQLFDTVDTDILYRQYWYKSGTNLTMKRQLKKIVDQIPAWVRLKDGDVVLDIGCNDGTLFSLYANDVNLTKVGIDPAENIAQFGRKHCDLHANTYFTKDTFLSLTGGRKAKVITSIAMFYDLENPHIFVEDINQCLDDDGVWIIQLSYTPLMLKQNAFDNICHEHIEYYTLHSLNYLLEGHNLKIVDVQLNDTNSGSFHVTIAKKSDPLNHVHQFIQDIGEYRHQSFLLYENKLGLNEPQAYIDFSQRVNTIRDKTMDLMRKLVRQGKTIFGYGASTKGNTLLQYYGIGTDVMKGIAERQPEKYGLMTAGSWIPIVSEDEMRSAKPDYLFVLPWHFIHEFCSREKDFLRGGGKFIVPLPDLQIIE